MNFFFTFTCRPNFLFFFYFDFDECCLLVQMMGGTAVTGTLDLEHVPPDMQDRILQEYHVRVQEKATLRAQLETLRKNREIEQMQKETTLNAQPYHVRAELSFYLFLSLSLSVLRAFSSVNNSCVIIFSSVAYIALCSLFSLGAPFLSLVFILCHELANTYTLSLFLSRTFVDDFVLCREQRHERALKRWEKAQREWQRQQESLAERLGRNIDDTNMVKMDDFRKKMEELELLDVSFVSLYLAFSFVPLIFILGSLVLSRKRCLLICATVAHNGK